MHPRNIYKNPPDFKKLAIKYPNFCSHVKIDLSGNAKLDFHNQAALAELSKTLLLEDFNLTVDIPVDKLVPTLPLRLNYILWIEDLLKEIPNTEEIYGIDIGTGASCIYPLLGAKKGWRMLATEIDSSSVDLAKRNVEKNSLDHLIKVLQVEKNDLLRNCTKDETNIFQFSMCNPPFFCHTEVPRNRTKNRKPPNNGHTGLSNELKTDGGEVAFVLKMIHESVELKNRIIIFTTMVGKQSSLKILRAKLKELGVARVTWTEFHQGKTTRWGLAWSFLQNLPDTPKKNNSKPLVFELPDGTNFDYSVQLIKQLLTDLKMDITVDDAGPGKFTSTVSASENTWANQRRMRRERLRMENGSPVKKIKLDEAKPSSSCTLKFILKCYEIRSVVSIEAAWVSGSEGKDGVHQVVQYLKNNWKIQA